MIFLLDSFLLILICFLLSISLVFIIFIFVNFEKKEETYHIGIHEYLRNQEQDNHTDK